jgi:hypothetical protein
MAPCLARARARRVRIGVADQVKKILGTGAVSCISGRTTVALDSDRSYAGFSWKVKLVVVMPALAVAAEKREMQCQTIGDRALRRLIRLISEGGGQQPRNLYDRTRGHDPSR